MTDENENKKELLGEEELDQVTGGGMRESFQDMFYSKFYKRAGVEIIEAPWLDDNVYGFMGKKYTRSELFKALDQAGFKPEIDKYGMAGLGNSYK